MFSDKIRRSSTKEVKLRAHVTSPQKSEDEAEPIQIQNEDVFSRTATWIEGAISADQEKARVKGFGNLASLVLAICKVESLFSGLILPGRDIIFRENERLPRTSAYRLLLEMAGAVAALY